MNPFRAWDRFWFEPRTTRALGLYRIALGLLTIYSFILFAKDTTIFFSDAGVLTRETLEKEQSPNRHYPMLLTYIGSPFGVSCVLAALFASGLLFTIGLWTRLSSILLFLLVTSFHERNFLVLNSGDTVLRTMLFLFIFSPAGAAFSVDSLRRRIRRSGEEADRPARFAPWAQRIMMCQTAIIYLVTVYAKSRGDLYHSGHALYYILGLVDFNVTGVEQLMNYPLLYSSLNYGMLFSELSIPFLLWFRASRPWAIVLGILLHGWIMWAMTIPVFGILMIATYLSFFDEEEVDGFIESWRRRFARHRARIFFDGDCTLCQRSCRVARILDLFERTEWVDVRRPPLAETLHLLTPRGKKLTGFHAFRWLALRLPATFWIAPLLYLPGVSRAYGWIARKAPSGRINP
jgi:uncharacterized membrane protein YphA (DoxX/SURF4 family)